MTPRTDAPPAPAAVSGRIRLLAAGAIAAVVTLSIPMTLGAFAYRPAGEAAAPIGIAAAFASAIVGAGVFGRLSRTRLPVAGPSSATVLVQAAMTAQLAAAGLSLPSILLGLAVSVVLAGAGQVLLARLGWARLVRFVPQPVLAGFMNGIAGLLLLAQVPALLGLAPGPWSTRPWHEAQWGALALGVGVAAAAWLLQWKARRLPGALLALLAGVAVYHLAAASTGAPALGPTVAAATASWPPIGVAALIEAPRAWQPLVPLLPTIVGQSLLLAVIAALDSILSLRALDHRLDDRSDASHELAAVGWANVAAGLVGALPTSITRPRALAIREAGGQGPVSAWGAALASALIIVAGGSLIGLLPQAVLAGSMLVVGVSLADRWSFDLLRQWLGARGEAASRNLRGHRQSLVIVAAVATVTIAIGPAAGVAVGVLLSGVAFIRGMNRSLLRARFDARARPSRRLYPPAQSRLLETQRQRIVVLELEGALFFGSAERLADEAEAVPPACRCVVLDLRRVGAVDDSGAVVLARLARRLGQRGIALLLAHVDSGGERHERLRHALRDAPSVAVYDDADIAIEAGERLLLAEHEAAGAGSAFRVEARQNELLDGLDETQTERVLALLEPVRLAAGERLFRQGEPADGVYLVLAGSVSIVATADEGGRRQRFVSLSPGTLFGEMAMLDGHGRTADAVADVETRLLRLPLPALQQLVAEQPAIGTALYRNMARYLARRLRAASVAWTAASA